MPHAPEMYGAWLGHVTEGEQGKACVGVQINGRTLAEESVLSVSGLRILGECLQFVWGPSPRGLELRCDPRLVGAEESDKEG